MEVDDNTITRKRTTSPSKSTSRSSSMSFGTSLMAYYDRIEIENNTLNDSQENRDENLYFSYTNIQANSVSTDEKVDTSPTAEAIQPINKYYLG